MARGWESKDVESQIEHAEAARKAARESSLTPDQITRQRELEGLRLSLKRVENDLRCTAHPRRRESLEAARRFLETKIQELS